MNKRRMENQDRKLRVIRVYASSRINKYGMGGLEKSDGYRSAPVTLPRLAFLEKGESSERTDSD